MSKKRGLSVEEKRSRMMDLFYEKKDFYQLKELEKLCQKEKGITSMSVKEILTSLVDDCMVDTEKIGTCVYFWAFPSKASQTRKRKLDDVDTRLKEVENKRKATEAMILKSRVGKEDSDGRAKILASLAQKEAEKKQLEADLVKYRECDPEVMDQMIKETTIAKEAVNRWTDNIFSTKSWIKKKFSFEESVINKQFEIPEDLDYV